MSGSLSLFILSGTGMITLLVSHYFQKSKPVIFQVSDRFIKRYIKKSKDFFRYFNKKTFMLLTHFVLDELEVFFGRVFKKLKNFVRKP